MKHKHSKVIKAWLDGIECEFYYSNECTQGWVLITDLRDFIEEDVRIKPEPQKEQEPQYLYVYSFINQSKTWMSPTLIYDSFDLVYLGKVRVEK
jgi:hypothetical protein